ncbi:MAG: diguanylate cyclase domain-containing protein [Deltaproteobacteria bacterium]
MKLSSAGYQEIQDTLSVTIKRNMTHFLRFNIVKKMLLGFLPISLLIIVIGIFALSNLNRLSVINDNITKGDLPLIETLDKIYNGLIAQEGYGRRYILLKSPDTKNLFWEKSREVGALIEDARKLRLSESTSIEPLAALYAEYNNLFGERFKSTGSSGRRRLDAQIKKKQGEVESLIETISASARQGQSEKAVMIGDTLSSAFRLTSALCILGIVLGAGAAVLITRNISSSIGKLRQATVQVSEGKFDNLPQVQSEDELGELSTAFGEMAKRLKRLEEMYLDANPLTRLPGGIAIENVLQKRLDSSAPVAFCLPDMNNFKSFNDQYGYARGNEVIQATAHIIEEAARRYGVDEDFVGHIGGDDFAVITTPDRYENICRHITETFDKMILDFYDPEDSIRGYIIGSTRQGQEMSFPIMTIAIAVVTNTNRSIKSHLEVGEIAAELKSYAKSLAGSSCVVDRRRENA